MNRPDSTIPRPRGAAPAEKAKPCASPFQSIALLLQGGGALGAYQAGVYEALLEAGVEPTWIAGISIGAINSAIIAGNPRETRIEKLRAFWDLVSDAGDGGWSAALEGLVRGEALRGWVNQLAAGEVMIRGVPGFFTPRLPPPYLVPPGAAGATSWYDTAALRSTLESLVDFDRINTREMRFSIGAVNVRTGNFAYFDNETDTIGPEHVMASGALPPAFPPVEIDGEFYWDGGMVSNTPLDWVLSARSNLDTLVFQVDLWSAMGELPRDLASVAVRMKEVQFSSRTRAATDDFRRLQALRATFNRLLAQMPPELAATPEARLLAKASDPAVYNIVQLVYRSPTYEGQSKDYEFSRRTMEDHWSAGRRDAEITLAHPEVLTLPTAANAVHVYDFITPRHDRSGVAPGPAAGPVRPGHRYGA
ncbi:patatin-like phospholipase family protein [Phenylobacterium montanum]|uniref:Patatin-like phospholipase family protein n=1 Tax=Phenylobacterium montanum TaxID=2823693 RepID=A0A975G2U8_9CAUL|nr:patatin-like phospholipase family protein [Caulobacter sp. S6]QUD89764.1 patatin-like phospholipase family protein [Caulobacter sp. S6]